ncbi:hypothetical protein [Streptomyces antimicrobicus]|uniref:DUF4124 domain-containing protein n=1 Tax=Streptomyces antimicrobicus TaxID=2883108 RepID=A0ABS8AZW0_9ACTN|nr:hypothetical protein [Streptomyces antimicrobicus]MCB5177885.1 hypothetical protein [Streptomyces antimicrobicus]
MRLRTTAAAFAGALALVLPTAAQALADDGGFSYTFVDKNGKEQPAQLRDVPSDTCMQLQHTSAEGPALSVANHTDAVALLFDNAQCQGEPRAVAGPGERHTDVNAVAVVFEAAQKADAESGPAKQESQESQESQAPAADEAADEAAVEEPADVVDEADDELDDEDFFATVFRALD